MRHALASIVIASAALAAACGDGASTIGPSDPAAVTPASSSLIGPTWRLASLDGRAALPGVRVTAVFGADDRVAGTAGCNGYFGRAAAAGPRLDVGLLASTRMFCGADGVMDQEQAYVDALGKVKAYRIEGTELQLGTAPGVVTVVFKAE